MHETSLVRTLLARVLREAADGQRVTRVELSLGEMASHTPEALAFHFDQAARGTAAEGASVDAVREEARLRCDACGEPAALGEPACPSCGGPLAARGLRDVRLEGLEVREEASGQVRTVRISGGGGVR